MSTAPKPRRRLNHPSPRPNRGRDRRAAKRTDRDDLVIILHPALFRAEQVAA